MRCPRCGFDNREGVRFCEECGGTLDQACPACGTAVPPGRKFCGSCGQPLVSSTASGPTRAVRSPESYTPRHLAEKILTSRSALEGERKQVTVLFADLKGSMELLADRDPEEARKLLDPVLERMMEAVHRYEGTVNQVMGDGIMALFGAPIAHEDHAVRARYAAHDMQAVMRRYTEEVRHAHGIEVQVRVGLNSGEVVVRAIGSDLHMDYTAVGQTTHLAARMEQLATPGTIRLTADTLRLAEGYIEVKPLGPVPVKGLETPIDVYEMVGAGPRRSRLHAAAARGLTRFVGRETELETLRHALARAAAGHGQVVAIVGEPGVGKSRLVWEVTHSHRIHGWLVLQAGLGLVRESDGLSARGGSPEGLLRDRGPRRPARGAGKGDGEALDTGLATEAGAFAQRVQAIGETLGDVPLQVAAQYYHAHVGYMSGDYRGTEDTCRRLMRFLQGDWTRERFGLAQSPAVLSHAFLARTLAERGVFHEGEAHGHDAIRIAEALSQAVRLLERAVALCRDWNITIFTPNAMASLGHVYAGSGRVGEGVSWLQQALAGHDSAGIGYFHSVSVVQIGEAYLLADQVEDARACADRAVRLARERGERGQEAWALRLLGDIASHQDRPDVATADTHYGAAMALATELGMRPLAAHCHLGLGKLYRRTGHHAKAQEHRTTAATMYREMDMRFWLEKAEAELRPHPGSSP